MLVSLGKHIPFLPAPLSPGERYRRGVPLHSPALRRTSLATRLSSERECSHINHRGLTQRTCKGPAFGECVFKAPALPAFPVLLPQSTGRAVAARLPSEAQRLSSRIPTAAPAGGEPSSPEQGFHSLLHFYFKFKRRNTGRK